MTTNNDWIDYRGNSTDCEYCAELTESYCDDCEADFAHMAWDDDEIHFADPTGHSALRAASPTNPRNLPCPNCQAPNRLTPQDRALGYQCDACADHAEMGF